MKKVLTTLTLLISNLKNFTTQYFSIPFWENIPLISGLRMAIAGILAFSIYSCMGWQEGYWSVVTIAAICQAGYTDTFTRGFMRLLGTLLGASIGYALAVFAQGNIWLILSGFMLLTIITNYISAQKNIFSYGGVVAGLTIVIVLSSSLDQGQVIQLGWYRSLQVIFGIAIGTLINLIFWILQKYTQKNTQKFSELFSIADPTHTFIKFNKRLLLTAIKISVASSITLITWLYFKYPYGFWATVSCFLIMEESHTQTHFRGYLRFLAHVYSAIAGAACALIIRSMWYLTIPLALGFFICGNIIGSNKPYKSLGNTMAMALAIMLLIDPAQTGTFYVVLGRLLNVMYGIAVGLFITKYLFPAKAAEVK